MVTHHLVMRSKNRFRYIALLCIPLYLLLLSVTGIASASASGVKPVRVLAQMSVTAGDNALLSPASQNVSVQPSVPFTLNFKAANTGTTTWGHKDDLQCTGQLCPVPSYQGIKGTVYPGSSYSFSVSLQASQTPSSYTLTWSMTNSGSAFGNSVTVNVTVQATPTNMPTPTNTPTPTATPTQTPTPTPVPTQVPTPTTTINTTGTVSPTQPSTGATQKKTGSSSFTLTAPLLNVTGQVGQHITLTFLFTNDSSQTLSNTDGYALQCMPDANVVEVQPEQWQVKSYQQQTFMVTLAVSSSPESYLMTCAVKDSKDNAIAHASVQIIVGKQSVGKLSTSGVPSVFNIWVIAGGGCGLLAFLLYLLPLREMNVPFLHRLLALFLPTAFLRNKQH